MVWHVGGDLHFRGLSGLWLSGAMIVEHTMNPGDTHFLWFNSHGLLDVVSFRCAYRWTGGAMSKSAASLSTQAVDRVSCDIFAISLASLLNLDREPLLIVFVSGSFRQ